MYHVFLGGVKFDPLSPTVLKEHFREMLKDRDCQMVVTPNPEIVLYAQKHGSFAKKLNSADLSLADGYGIILASKLFGGALRQTITGMDAMDMLLGMANEHNLRVYFLGGKDEVAKQAAKRAKEQYPHIAIVGAEQGMNARNFSLQNHELVERINRSKADILIVAFGAPKQEEWIYENKNKLHSVRIAIGVGGGLDYLSGRVRRAPEIFQNFHLEWIFRLFTQPYRVIRIFRAVVIFPIKMIFWRFASWFRYRKNVVGVIFNRQGKILLVSPRRRSRPVWQLPQGGVDKGEGIKVAAFREMEEEVGIEAKYLRIKKVFRNFYSYIWPDWARGIRPYKGQKQTAVIFKYLSDEQINVSGSEEISRFKWVTPEELANTIAPIRKEMALKILKHLKNTNI